MKAASFVCLVMAVAWPMVGVSQTPVWSEDDWQPLINEPSRRDLLRSSMDQEVEMESVPRGFRFPEDTSGTNDTFGVDISHYQPTNLPFEKFAKNNIHYVYVKATQGVQYKDDKFKHFWTSIGALPASQRIARGAYHFLSASYDPEQQADRFVAYVNLQGGIKQNDLPPVVDLEWDKATVRGPDRWSSLTSAQIVTAVLKFLSRVEALTGRIPMVYTSHAWWQERHIPESEIAKFSRYKLWIADYSTKTLRNENPRGPNNRIPELWQFTDRATVSGGPKAGFDADIFKGTLEQFQSEFLGTANLNFMN